MYDYINGFFIKRRKPDKILGGCIEIFKNCIDNVEEIVNEIDKNLDSINWLRAGTIDDGINQKIRTNYNINLTKTCVEEENVFLKNLHNKFTYAMSECIYEYSEKHKVDELFFENYFLLKYSDNQMYNSHYDGNTETGRSISAICYLNNNYIGGEIEFNNFGIKIKPEPGMIILFPSNYAYSHIAHPVTEGTKYAIVTWIKDREV